MVAELRQQSPLGSPGLYATFHGAVATLARYGRTRRGRHRGGAVRLLGHPFWCLARAPSAHRRFHRVVESTSSASPDQDQRPVRLTPAEDTRADSRRFPQTTDIRPRRLFQVEVTRRHSRRDRRPAVGRWLPPVVVARIFFLASA